MRILEQLKNKNLLKWKMNEERRKTLVKIGGHIVSGTKNAVVQTGKLANKIGDMYEPLVNEKKRKTKNNNEFFGNKSFYDYDFPKISKKRKKELYGY